MRLISYEFARTNTTVSVPAKGGISKPFLYSRDLVAVLDRQSTATLLRIFRRNITGRKVQII